MIVTSIGDTGREGCGKSDAELIRDICAQRTEELENAAIEHAALDSLFHRYVRLVHRIAHGILRDRAEAEDVTQEVFLEIYRKAHLYSAARGSFRAWLLQYAYHRTLRRKAVLRRRAAYVGEPIDEAEECITVVPQSLTRDECRWVLRTGLAQLPTRQRTTLELTCFEDLPLPEVAKRLGVSVGCTRHYYYRGLARLQQWARVTDRPAAECRSAGRGDTTGAGRGRDRRLYVRI